MDKCLTPDRRIYPRLPFKTSMRVASGNPAQLSKRRNRKPSRNEEPFSLRRSLAVGSAVEILVRMPQEITGKPAPSGDALDTWCVSNLSKRAGNGGVGVEFDCYEILRSKTRLRFENV